MNTNDLAHDARVEFAEQQTESNDGTIETWTQLVRRHYPNLATPIARAMAQRAAQGPYGLALQSIEEGLTQFNAAALSELTGSELQMLSALLLHLQTATQNLLAQVNAQWRTE